MLVEPDDILARYLEADNEAVAAKKQEILGFFDTPDPGSEPIAGKLTDADLTTAAKAAVALDGLIVDKALDGLAYYYEGRPGSEIRTLVTNLIVGNSLLTSAGFPMCGEFDIKTCIAMLIMDRLDIGGSFAEFHPVDFERDSVLVGHDGPHHINIAASRPALRSLNRYQARVGGERRVPDSGRPDYDAQYRRPRRRQVQVHHRRGRIGAPSHPADGQHQHPRGF